MDPKAVETREGGTSKELLSETPKITRKSNRPVKPKSIYTPPDQLRKERTKKQNTVSQEVTISKKANKIIKATRKKNSQVLQDSMLSDTLSNKEAGIEVTVVGDQKRATLVIVEKNQAEETDPPPPIQNSSVSIDLLKAKVILANQKVRDLETKNKEAYNKIAQLEQRATHQCCNSGVLEKILSTVESVQKNVNVLMTDRQELRPEENTPNKRAPVRVVTVSGVNVLDHYYHLSTHDQTLNTRVKNLIIAYFGPEIASNVGFKWSEAIGVSKEEFVRISLQDSDNIYKLVIGLEETDTKLPPDVGRPITLDAVKTAISCGVQLIRKNEARKLSSVGPSIDC